MRPDRTDGRAERLIHGTALVLRLTSIRRRSLPGRSHRAEPAREPPPSGLPLAAPAGTNEAP